MTFEKIKTNFDGLFILKPKIFFDKRGYFYEAYNNKKISNLLNIKNEFVQDNISFSKKGILRGLHFQSKKPQAKLVSVIKGEIFDVVVDLRKGSKTFGNWDSFKINERDYLQIFIPEGFAHGFLTLSKEALIIYKTSDYYDPNNEFTLCWNDKELNIKWPTSNIL